jgi:hypothetical protein
MPRTHTCRMHAPAGRGYQPGMLTRALSDTGLRGCHLHAGSLGAIYLCIALWIRAKTVDQEERGNAERRALFVGLWPPMFWLMGDALQLEERTARARPTLLGVLHSPRGRNRSWIARTRSS